MILAKLRASLGMSSLVKVFEIEHLIALLCRDRWQGLWDVVRTRLISGGSTAAAWWQLARTSAWALGTQHRVSQVRTQPWDTRTGAIPVVQA